LTFTNVIAHVSVESVPVDTLPHTEVLPFVPACINWAWYLDSRVDCKSRGMHSCSMIGWPVSLFFCLLVARCSNWLSRIMYCSLVSNMRRANLFSSGSATSCRYLIKRARAGSVFCVSRLISSISCSSAVPDLTLRSASPLHFVSRTADSAWQAVLGAVGPADCWRSSSAA